jgi:peptide/nickel transport system substrate-binding protein
MNRMTGVPLITFFLFTLGCQSKTITTTYDPSTVDITPVNGGYFIEPSIGDASFLNPLLATDSASGDINGQVFNGLVKYDKNIELIGDLAESWDVDNGGKKLTFRLRKNVRWHDGQPFTSADVQFTYEKLIDPTTRTPFGADYMIVSRVETPDNHTFVVYYDKPFAPALESWAMGVIPKHIFEGSDINTHPANREPIGTGPYVFSKWETDQVIELTANEDYFEGRPHFDRYIYRIIPDLSVQFLELRQGTWSMMGPTPDQFNGYDKFFVNYNKFTYPGHRYDYVALNLRNPLFKNLNVRTALAHAVDKEAILSGVYQGLAVPCTGPYPPSSWAWNPDVAGFAYDPSLAKTILEKEGWVDSNEDGIVDKDGKEFEFTLMTNQGNKVRESIAQIIQANFQEIGIKMNIRILEWSAFIHEYINPRKFEACLLGWNLSRDPDLFAIWHSSQIEQNQYNMVYYNNPIVDDLIIQGRTTFDRKKRKEIYFEVHERIAKDVPYLFLVTPLSLPVVHKKIMNVELAPAGLGWNFIEWYIPKEWQRNAQLAS